MSKEFFEVNNKIIFINFKKFVSIVFRFETFLKRKN